jgi:phage terminase large subunit-like protein
MNLNAQDLTTQRHLAAAQQLLSYTPNSDKLMTMHQDGSKTRLILGGKRSGKTTFGVVECCWAALGIHPFLDFPKPPLKIRVCSVDFNSGIAGIILPMFETWLPKHAVKKFWSETRVLELKNGTEIDFKSYDQDIEKFEGVERHLVWMDEEPPRDVYESNFMRTVSGGINGKILITCTPLHGLTWVYDVLYDNPSAKPPAVSHCHVSIFENPHLDKAAIESVKNDPAMKDSLESALYGLFIAKSGLIYKDFGNVNMLRPEAPKPDWMIVLGIDPHDRNPHGVVFSGLSRDNVWIVFDEIMEQCTIKDLVGMIKTKLGTRWPPALAIIDTSAHAPQSISGRSVADEMKMMGLPTIPAFKDWQPGVLKLSSLISPGGGQLPKLYVMENCANLIREFRHYVWADWARKRDKYNPKEMPLKKDDHLLDALRYLVMSNIVYRPPGFGFKPKTPVRISPITGYF